MSLTVGKPGDITELPRANEAGDGNLDNIHNSTRFVEDAHSRLKSSATLAYNFPQRLLSDIKVQNLSIYATAQNL